MKYAAVFERTATGFSAYVPDVPGCIATGATVDDARRLIGEALDAHLATLRSDGQSIPEPSTAVEYVHVDLVR